MKLFRITVLSFLLQIFCIQVLHGNDLDSLRMLYYQSVEKQDALNEAFNMIRVIRENNETSEALLEVYEGSLIGLKGKHTRQIRKKYDYVMEALPVMEKARLADSSNVEILFIQGTTTYYLPFFFGQSKRAEKNFHRIVRLLPEVHKEYPREIVRNVIEFLKENPHLCPEEKDCLDDLLNILDSDYEI